MAVLVILIIFTGIFSAERTREILRKPYVIPEYMYSNQIIGKGNQAKGVHPELNVLREKGILKVHPFVPHELREIKIENRISAGRFIALVSCSSCHTLNGSGLRPLPKMFRRLGMKSQEDIEGFLEGIDAYPYMPPFSGTEEERKVLSEYLLTISK